MPERAIVNSRRPVPRAVLVCAAMDPGLMQQTWSVVPHETAPTCRCFFVDHGQAEFVDSSRGGILLSGPAMLWLPRSTRGAFRLDAGSQGSTLSVPEDLVWRALGDSQVLGSLRPVFDRLVLASTERLRPSLGQIRMAFASLVRETRDQAPGANAIMTLNLALVLLHLWRSSGLATTTGLRGTAATTIQRFKQLVELHYRETLAIDDFARLLGVTRSHLQEACAKATGRTPLKLVHDRLAEEARLRLEQTELPVEQIGYSLGFRDAAYFNRFFKRMTGQTPGAHRATVTAARSGREPQSFAAWP